MSRWDQGGSTTRDCEFNKQTHFFQSVSLGSCHKELNRGGRKGFQNSPQDYVAQCKTQKLFT